MTISSLTPPKPLSDPDIVDAIASALKKAYECRIMSVSIAMHIADGVYCTIEAYANGQVQIKE